MSGKLHSICFVSGGQTGVDRAALDAAIDAGIQVAGWCPKGRLAEDGVLSSKYPLKETASSSYAERTELNVRDSDGTLVLYSASLTGGTALTVELAVRYRRPCFQVALIGAPDTASAVEWIKTSRLKRINVAGPRESNCPGIYREAYRFLKELIANLQGG